MNFLHLFYQLKTYIFKIDIFQRKDEFTALVDKQKKRFTYKESEVFI